MTIARRILRTFAPSASGYWCRSCGNPICRDDAFGVSEAVCAPCRRATATT
jgi:hypothetical protein